MTRQHVMSNTIIQVCLKRWKSKEHGILKCHNIWEGDRYMLVNAYISHGLTHAEYEYKFGNLFITHHPYSKRAVEMWAWLFFLQHSTCSKNHSGVWNDRASQFGVKIHFYYYLWSAVVRTCYLVLYINTRTTFDFEIELHFWSDMHCQTLYTHVCYMIYEH